MGNELVLSNDLNIITAEINSYKQVAGQAIFEIGRRLKWVKENDLVHGEWGNWIENIGISRGQATKFITVYEQFGGNGSTWNHLGTQALYLIATLPEEEREKIHTVPSTGEQKTVDEMTVRELREVKKALKEAEEDKKRLAMLLTEERNKPLKIETKIVETVKEVMPKDKEEELENYKLVSQARDQEISRLKQLLHKTSTEKVEIENKIKQIDIHKKSEESLLKELELKEKKLKHESHVSIYELQLKIQAFIKDASPSLFLQGAISYGDVNVRKELIESVKALEDFTDQMKNILGHGTKINNQTIIDMGEF